MLLTRIESESGAPQGAPAARPRFRRHAGAKVPTMDRRAFLQRSGLVAGAGAFASQLPLGVIGKADAAAEAAASKTEVKRTVCTHCSVGCSVDAIVENGVWIRQEPVFSSPLNLGAHCAKGAAVRVKRGSTTIIRAPVSFECSMCSIDTGCASAALEPM